VKIKELLKKDIPLAFPSGRDADVVLRSSAGFYRNLAGFPFPSLSSRADRAVLRKMLVKGLSCVAAFRDAGEYSLSGAGAAEMRFAGELGLAMPFSPSSLEEASLLVPPDTGVIAGVNMDETLFFRVTREGFSVSPTLDEASNLDDGIGQAVDYAWDEELGFLCARPARAGTGLEASCLLHLAGLVKAGRISTAVKTLVNMKVRAQPVFGEDPELSGGFFLISNSVTMGISEAESAQCLEAGVRLLCAAEREARLWISGGERHPRFADEVWRSLGALEHARMMSFQEAAGHISNVRLGICLNMGLPARMGLLCSLLRDVQDGRMALSCGELPVAERDVFRASYIRARFTEARHADKKILNNGSEEKRNG